MCVQRCIYMESEALNPPLLLSPTDKHSSKLEYFPKHDLKRPLGRHLVTLENRFFAGLLFFYISFFFSMVINIKSNMARQTIFECA